jgi:hypothetical protein
VKKLFINSLPKSGTNLLSRIIDLSGYRYRDVGLAATLVHGRFYYLRQFLRGALFDKNPLIIGQDLPMSISSKWVGAQINNISIAEYITGHCNYSDHLYLMLKEQNIKTIMVVRDPRDMLISYAYYVAKTPSHFLYNHYKNLTHEERIDFTINGGKAGTLYIESLAGMLNSLNGWFNKSDVMIVKFEDIIGSKGGGNDEVQKLTVENIFNFLDIEQTKMNNVLENFYGASHTFRKGQIGNWKEELTNKQVADLKNNIGYIMNYWNYEW